MNFPGSMNKNKKGLTFLELMVTVVILGTGIVLIYQGLLKALDYQKHMLYRAYALNLLEHKTASLQYAFQNDVKVPVFADEPAGNIVLNNNQVSFSFSADYEPLASLANIYAVDMMLSWTERGRDFSIKRSVYVSKF